jgi:hypothetical protein
MPVSNDLLKRKLAVNLRNKLIIPLCQELSSIFNTKFTNSNFTDLSEVNSVMERSKQSGIIYSNTISGDELKSLTNRILKYGDIFLEDYDYLQLPQFMDVGLLTVRLSKILEHLSEILSTYEMVVFYTSNKSYGFLFNIDRDGIEVEIWVHQWKSIIDSEPLSI